MFRRSQSCRLGVLDPKQKKDFFAGLDLFVLPSRSDSFGLVLLEAWANGVPNIGYRAGGIADVIRHEQDGLLVPCGDIASLTRSPSSISSFSRPCVGKWGKPGKIAQTRDFRWQDKLSLVRDHYERLTSR